MKSLSKHGKTSSTLTNAFQQSCLTWFLSINLAVVLLASLIGTPSWVGHAAEEIAAAQPKRLEWRLNNKTTSERGKTKTKQNKKIACLTPGVAFPSLSFRARRDINARDNHRATDLSASGECWHPPRGLTNVKRRFCREQTVSILGWKTATSLLKKDLVTY